LSVQRWFATIQQKHKEVAKVSDVTAPMAGKIIDVKINVGDTVNEDDELIILEAMKMEIPIVAPASGNISEIKCKKGDSVGADDVLAVIE
jgi:acetyl-CoA carboxylase biotin carboxyl carrier protein